MSHHSLKDKEFVWRPNSSCMEKSLVGHSARTGRSRDLKPTQTDRYGYREQECSYKVGLNHDGWAWASQDLPGHAQKNTRDKSARTGFWRIFTNKVSSLTKHDALNTIAIQH